MKNKRDRLFFTQLFVPQASQSSYDRRAELEVLLAIPSAQSACGMEIFTKNGMAVSAMPFFVMGFILLRVLEFFVFRKMEMPETKNHLLCGWSLSGVQKNHLSVTIELFRHYCKIGKVILWRIRFMI